MYWDISKLGDIVTIEIDDEELIEKVLNDLEDIIKSTVFHSDYTSAKEYIDMFLKLDAVYKELIKKNDPEVIEDV